VDNFNSCFILSVYFFFFMNYKLPVEIILLIILCLYPIKIYICIK